MKRFRTPTLSAHYDHCVTAYRNQSRLLFRDGQPMRGNGVATAFWRGFDGVPQNWDRWSRRTWTYASYLAGQDCRKGR